MRDSHRTFVVVSHTHWDREWYQPFEEFRARLVRMMDPRLVILSANHAGARNPAASRRDLVARRGVNGLRARGLSL
jgi:hypothetical protein